MRIGRNTSPSPDIGGNAPVGNTGRRQSPTIEVARPSSDLPLRLQGATGSPSLPPSSTDATDKLQSLGELGRKRKATPEALGAASAAKLRRVQASDTSPAPLAAAAPPEDTAADSQGVPIDAQRALAIPVGRLRQAEIAAAAQVGAAKGATAAGQARPAALPPRSLDLKVMARLPMRDEGHPELIKLRYAKRLPGGGFDQTQCDEHCKFLEIEFDDEFKGMVKAWCGADSDAVLLRLQRAAKREYVEMINNRIPPSLTQYLNTELNRSHCQSDLQWKNLNKGGLANGVTLANYEDQEAWSLGPPCARIAVPAGEVAEQAYKDAFGEMAFDDFALQMRVRRTQEELAAEGASADTEDGEAHEDWHAALYGCGLAQLFNGAAPGEQFHLVFANAAIKMRDPEGNVWKEPVPQSVQVNKVPRGKQLLAWYGDGWFETRPSLLQAPQAADVVAQAISAGLGEEPADTASEASPKGKAAERSTSPSPRPQLLERIRQVTFGRDRRALQHLKEALDEKFRLVPGRRKEARRERRRQIVAMHLARSVDFIDRLKQPVATWLAQNDTGAGSPQDRVRALLAAAREQELHTDPDLWRLQPLMQSLLGFPVSVDKGARPDPPALRLKLDEIAHPANRIEMVQFRGALEARMPAPIMNERINHDRVQAMQLRTVNPAARFVDWLGLRSARDWATQNVVVPEQGPTEKEVTVLCKKLQEQGGSDTVIASALRPFLRQLLDLPPLHAVSTATASPLAPFLQDVLDGVFQKEEWADKLKLDGFEALQNDEARASLAALWTQWSLPIEKASLGAKARSNKLLMERKPLRQAWTLLNHWGGTLDGLHAWLDEHDPGAQASVSANERWLALLEKLKGEFPDLPKTKLSDSRKFIEMLLAHRDFSGSAGAAGDTA